MKKIGSVVHFGFLTFALMFLIVLIAISFVMPDVFHDILETISEIAKAVRGEQTVLALI